METGVKKLFERYEQVFRNALRGDIDMNEAASLYAAEFIAATPAGVSTGKNDVQLKQVMANGYERYRAQGMKDMRMRGLRISPIDERHCVAHVAWTATYARESQPEVTIDFEVHYFVQELNSEPKVFGWFRATNRRCSGNMASSNVGLPANACVQEGTRCICGRKSKQ